MESFFLADGLRLRYTTVLTVEGVLRRNLLYCTLDLARVPLMGRRGPELDLALRRVGNTLVLRSGDEWVRVGLIESNRFPCFTWHGVSKAFTQCHVTNCVLDAVTLVPLSRYDVGVDLHFTRAV
jgi:hypothetical protein